MFIRFDMIHERDRQTDRQTPHADIGRAYASHRAAKTALYIMLKLTIQTNTKHRAAYLRQLSFLLTPRCVKYTVCIASLHHHHKRSQNSGGCLVQARQFVSSKFFWRDGQNRRLLSQSTPPLTTSDVHNLRDAGRRPPAPVTLLPMLPSLLRR